MNAAHTKTKTGLTNTKWQNPLKHKESFNQGDSLRATDRITGLTEGIDYPILGWWNRDGKALYAYLDASPIGHYKWFRSAVDEKRTDEEVLFYQLPDVITEICIQDNLFGLEYVPAMDTERIMWPNRDKEEERERDNVIPLHTPVADEKGQYLLFRSA